MKTVAKVPSRTKPERYPESTLVGGNIIYPRVPIFALTTAFTCIVTACLLCLRGSWMWSAAFIALSILLVIWQIHAVCTSPLLVVCGPVVTLYRSGAAAGSFMLSDMLIAEGNLWVGLALFAMILASAFFCALGISRSMEMSLSLFLSSIQRFVLNVTGVWFGGGAVSLSHLDFPRRKLLLRSASIRSRVFYFDNRKQRDQLLKLLRARELEEVMLRVGLGSYIPTTKPNDADMLYDRRNGPEQ
jgi:hypothetical protein